MTVAALWSNCSRGVSRVPDSRRHDVAGRAVGCEERRVAHLRRRPRAARDTRRSTRSTPTNFNKLEVAWRFKTDNLGPRPEFQFEGNAADGQRRALFDRRQPPRRGRARCRQPASSSGCTASSEGARGAAAPRQLSGRGLAYWTDGREERILYVTPGYRLIALECEDGRARRRLRQRTASSI